MLENNVITKNNLKEFGSNPFLMTDPIECKEILKELPKNVGLLIDVGHLKVSARTLKFKPKKMFIDCKKRIFGYHLSDNNGKKDANAPFTKKSWFWKYLDRDIKYFSIEVYDIPFSRLSKILKIAEKQLK